MSTRPPSPVPGPPQFPPPYPQQPRPGYPLLPPGVGAPPPAPAWGQRPQWSPAPGVPGSGSGSDGDPGAADRLDSAWLRVAGQQGAVPLRPLGLVELLDSAFATVRTSPALILGTAAVVGTVATVLDAVPRLVVMATGGHGDPVEDHFGSHEFVGGLAGFVFETLGIVLAAAVVACLLAPVALDSALGRRTSASGLRATWRRRAPGILAATLTVAVLLFVGLAPALLGFAMVAGSEDSDGVVLVTLGLIVWLPVWMMFVAGRLMVFLPALLGENLPLPRALRRSWHLTRGGFWRLAWLQFVAWAMTFLAATVLTIASDLAASAVGDPDDPAVSMVRAVGSEAIATLGEVGALAVLLPFLACLLALAHLDLRLRREGLAVRLLRDLGRRGNGRTQGEGNPR